MAYSESLAGEVRALLAARDGFSERKMFGGLCFMLHGNMCCGIVGDELMVRLGEAGDAALERPHTRPMDFTGRPMRGFLFVEPPGLAGDADLRAWVEQAAAFAESLPPKRR